MDNKYQIDTGDIFLELEKNFKNYEREFLLNDVQHALVDIPVKQPPPFHIIEPPAFELCFLI